MLLQLLQMFLLFTYNSFGNIPQVETPDNPFAAPVNIKVIQSFMQSIGYQGVVDKGKNRKQSVGDMSSPRKSLKVIVRKKKQTTTLLPPPSDDRERDEMAEATLLNEEEIEKRPKGEEDEESYASEYINSMLNDDVDDTGTRLALRSHKKNPKAVDDDDKDDNKVDNDKKYDDVEKAGDVAEKKDNDDQTDHTLVGSGSMETRNE
nr:hypothetical protein [Tanacetum cinerariifolium]